MKQDFFTYLPPEITINILSRLPIRATMSCSCVSRSWLDLIKTPEFDKYRLSQSVPGIAVFEGETPPMPYKIYEFVDEVDPLDSVHYYNVAFNFSFPHSELIHSSVHGLLFLFDHNVRPHKLFICNPITRDYIKLPDPHLAFFFKPHPHKLPPPPPPTPQYPSSSKRESQLDTFGFGVSKMSGQYKVVRVYHERLHNQGLGLNQPECQVYTLGTGSWRSIEASGGLKYECNSVGAFLNGSFHWLVYDLELCPWISCFDFET